MQIVLKHIGILVPLTVEVAEHEPLRVEAFLWFWSMDSAKEQFLELIVGQTVLLAGADVVETAPELLRHIALAEVCHAARRILHSSPFKHTAERHMEHYRVEILEDSRVKDARLAERHPVADARLHDGALSDSFRDSVVVIDRDRDRVACTSPVNRFVAVGRLSHSADVADLDIVSVRLSENCFGDVGSSGSVHTASTVWIVVSRRRDKSADMQHIVGILSGTENILVASEVAPDHADLVHVWSKKFLILLAFTSQDSDFKTIPTVHKLLKCSEAHISSGSGNKYSFHHNYKYINNAAKLRHFFEIAK